MNVFEEERRGRPFNNKDSKGKVEGGDSEFKLLREALEICDDFMVIEVAKRWVTVD